MRSLSRRVRHVAGDDALSDTLHDGGLAHAGFADEHGVVLGVATSTWMRLVIFFAATDHRVELAGARQVAHVAAILLKRLELRLVFCRGNAIVASKLLVDLLDALARHAGVVEHAACIALVLGKGHEQVLGYHETIAHLARVLLGALEHAHEVARKPDLGTITCYLGGAVDGFLRRAAELRRIGTDALDDDRDVALAAREQRRKQVNGLDGASLGVARDADGRLQRLQVIASLSILMRITSLHAVRQVWRKAGVASASEWGCG